MPRMTDAEIAARRARLTGRRPRFTIASVWVSSP
jgi:hypothetical protein